MGGTDEQGIARVLRRFPNGRPDFMLVSDLDHTMVQNEDPTHARQLAFNAAWQRDFAARSLLVWSTGRSPALFRELWLETPLLTPDVLICSVGTEVFYRDPDTSEFFEDKEWARRLDAGGRWRRGEAERAARAVAALKPQRASEQRPHKLSFHSPPGEAGQRAVAELRAALDGAGMTEDVAKIVYSGGTDVDVLAAGAGKGRALEVVREELRRAGGGNGGGASSSFSFLPAGLQVNGDSGNDAELFEVEGARGCVVSNAHEELRAWYAAWRERESERSKEKEEGESGGVGGNEGGGDGGASAPPPLARVQLASQPCSGGILEVLGKFGTAAAVARLEEEAEVGGAAAAGLLRAARRMVVEGGGRLAAAQGQECGDQTWLDRLRVRPVTIDERGECVEVTFETWSGGGDGSGADSSGNRWRRRPTVRQTTALLARRGPHGGSGELEVVRVQEITLEAGDTATAKLAALVDSSGAEGGGGAGR